MSTEPRLTIVTLGVADLARARRFYCDGLGFQPSSSSNEHITFLDGGGIVLALFSREALAEDACLPPAGSGFGGFTLARNVASRAAVDEALAQARAAGATILKPAREAVWGGYSGYFADLDGHPWEVAHNPHWELDPRGLVRLPR
jgi:catechol 2,3-dioxygenase-like lactoylglutathione lyase family enzyme